ncbi:MAG: hypothetical protein ACR2KQ_00355 [Actinomycetota bacterium]
MTPELKRRFEADWPALERRLKLVLFHRRVPLSQQDDLLQEVALRLVGTWTTVDKERTWMFTKTILLNLLRDEYRRRATRPENVSEMPDVPAQTDIEEAGLARIEIERVRKALGELSEAHRSVLLQEVGEHPLQEPDPGAATKMMRMRARRKLNAAVEKISAVVILRSKKVWDVVHGLIGVRDEIVPALGCVLCLIVGAGSALSVTMPAPAEAGVMPPSGGTSHPGAIEDAVDMSEWATELPSRGEQLAASTSADHRADKPSSKKKGSVKESGPEAEGNLLTPPEEVPVEAIPTGVVVGVDPGSGGGGGDPREQVPTGSPITAVALVEPPEIQVVEQIEISL